MAHKESVHILTDRVERLACHKCGHRIDVRAAEPFTSVECPQCHVQTPVPAQLGSFLLFKELGKGAMGAVYQAFDSTLKRHVAIKVMHRSLGEDKKFVAQFLGEARALAALNNVNVVQIYSCGQEKGQPYIVMELVPGGRVDKLMAQKDALDEKQILKTGLDVAQGLKAAYDIGLTHGDIKPENIMFGKDGTGKVVDFGLAKFAGGDRKPGEIWGTPFYISPEVVRGKAATHQSDIYSLGATLFHALAGKPPFDADSPIEVVKARLTRPAPDIRTIRGDLHPETAALIARMLEAEPHVRYPNYDSLLADIRKTYEAVAHGPVPIGTSGEKKFNPVWIGAAVAVLAVAAGGGWWLKNRNPPPAPAPTSHQVMKLVDGRWVPVADEASKPVPMKKQPDVPADRPPPPVEPEKKVVEKAPEKVVEKVVEKKEPAPQPSTFTLPLTVNDADFIISTADGNGADAYIQGKGKSTDNADTSYGDKKELWVKAEKEDSLHLVRKVYLRFDLSPVQQAPIRDATLRLAFVKGGKNTAGDDYILKIWGVKTAAAGGWSDQEDAGALTWNTAPANDMTSVDALTADAVLLAEVSVPANASEGDSFAVSNSDSLSPNLLVDFINQAGPFVTFALTADGKNIPKAGWKFASREHGKTTAPTLLLKK